MYENEYQMVRYHEFFRKNSIAKGNYSLAFKKIFSYINIMKIIQLDEIFNGKIL